MTPPDDTEDADPGQARARTELAWTRTAVSCAAVGGSILKMHPAAGLPVLLLSAVIWKLGRRARPDGQASARPGHLRALAIAVTGVSLIALALTLSGPGFSGIHP